MKTASDLANMTFEERKDEAVYSIRHETYELHEAAHLMGRDLRPWELELVAIKVKDALETFKKCIATSMAKQAERR